MTERGPRLLLDQNIPYPTTSWLRWFLPGCDVEHVQDIGLGKAGDTELFQEAQRRRAIIITYDEDFADQRLFPVGEHSGVIRLRVQPTTDEATVGALTRLFERIPLSDIAGKLVIIDNRRIRLISAKG